MRILHVIETMQTGGAENLLRNTIQELTGHQHLIVTVFAQQEVPFIPTNATYICLGVKSKAGVPFARRAYRKLLKSFNPDVVHAHLYFACLLTKAFTPRHLPLVFTQHFEFSKNVSRWYYAAADRLVSSKKQTCVAVSQTVLKDYVHSTGFPGKTKVIGIYIPDRYFALEKKRRFDGHLKLMALGNVKAIKNHKYLIEGFDLFKDLPVSCDIYGDGPDMESLEAAARHRNVAVHFKGTITDSAAVLPEYDAYIMPSLTEGFPLALFEASASGLPALVSDIPVFREVLDGEGDYFLLSDPSTLRPLVERYLQQPDLIKRQGERMRNIASGKVKRSLYLQKINALYQELADQKA